MSPRNNASNLNIPSSSSATSSLTNSRNSTPKNPKENVNSARFSSKARKKSSNTKENANTTKKQTTNSDKQNKPSKKFSALSATRTQNKNTDNKKDNNTSKDIKDTSNPANSSNLTTTRANQATADSPTSQLLEQQCNNAFDEAVQRPVISPTMSLSPYQNTQGIVGLDSYDSSNVNSSSLNKSTSNLNSVCNDINNVVSTYNSSEGNTVDYRKKKPVPLPRSKIPLASQQQLELEKAEETPKPVQRTSVASRLFWKRSKTDLGVDAVTSYKANKQKRGKDGNALSNVKYPAPKVPTFNRPLPQCSELPVVIDVPNVKRRSSTITTDRKARDARQRQHLTPGNVIRPDNANLKGTNVSSRTDTDINTKPKPELKEKPTFSTFKQQASSNTSLNHTLRSENDNSKQASGASSARKDSTLSKRIALGGLSKSKDYSSSSVDENNHLVYRGKSRKTELGEVIETTLSSNDNTSRINGEKESNKNHLNYNDKTTKKANQILDNADMQQSSTTLSQQDLIGQSQYTNTFEEISHDKNFKVAENSKKKQQKSAPLMISTEPLVSQLNNEDNNDFEENDNRYVNVENLQERMSESADKSCSTSFDSMEDSSAVHGSRAFSNSSTSSVLSAALANAQNQLNLLSTNILTSGSDMGVCKITPDETLDDNIIKNSNKNVHISGEQILISKNARNYSDTETNILPETNAELYQDDASQHDNLTTPEPTSHSAVSMSDSSVQLKSPVSTTSRSPPSPTSIGATPTRQVRLRIFIHQL